MSVIHPTVCSSLYANCHIAYRGLPDCSTSRVAQLAQQREVPGPSRRTRAGLLLLDQVPQISGCFRLHPPPQLTHPANRPGQPGLRRSELILLISEASHEGARFHPDE